MYRTFFLQIQKVIHALLKKIMNSSLSPKQDVLEGGIWDECITITTSITYIG